MSEAKNCGVITIIDELNASLKVEELKKLVTDLEPFLKDASIDSDVVALHFDVIIDKMARLTEKANLTYQLVHNVIDSIHSSRKELKMSVDGLLKQTGNQLHKITSTTQDATNKILDEADKLNSDQDIIIGKLDELKKAAAGDATDAIIEEIKGMVYSNQESTFNIMGHLQFQDITAQQIAGAYSLLSDTEKTLIYVSNLMKEFDFGENDPDVLLQSIDKNSFNAEATFKDKAEIQGLIDDLFETGSESVDVASESKPSVSAPKPAPSTESAAAVADDLDIDALFGKPSSGGESSAVADGELDIDALFGKSGDSEPAVESSVAAVAASDEELDVDALFGKSSGSEQAAEPKKPEVSAESPAVAAVAASDGELDIDALFGKSSGSEQATEPKEAEEPKAQKPEVSAGSSAADPSSDDFDIDALFNK